MAKTNKKAERMAEAGGEHASWTVLGLPTIPRIDYVLCRCRCGKEKEVNVYSLSSGKSKSCGCKALQNRADTKESYNG